VKHGKHDLLSGSYAIKDSVRELADQGLANISMDYGVQVGCRGDSIEDSLHLMREFDTEPSALPLVPIKRFVELCSGFRS
jgi:hypothetical protein